MNFVKPTLNEVFTITSAPEWPSISFQTDAAGSHTWQWSIVWGKFKKSGKVSTGNNSWDASDVIANCGGTLTVRVEASTAFASMSVQIKGTNPAASEVTQYLASKLNSAGFEKIIEQESKFRHFDAGNEPVRSFDNGYGMCQLTNPVPGYEQVWNWKLNVDAALQLFEQKRTSAMAYLGQQNRTYTDEQLKYETICRWNGGTYHEWDAKAGQWVRPSHILCDSRTGNIGWDMNQPENKGKTEAELHSRDKSSYSKPPGTGAHWKYYGICYADRILG